ncbi:hypothetical protein AVJ24_18490 [Yersinia pestis]|nr:hypothetical protein AVJ24_18490 [Yersinia pestis]
MPAPDMEHFLYRAGLMKCITVFRRSRECEMQPRRVIDKAIHRTSKPDLAIEVASQAGQWG